MINKFKIILILIITVNYSACYASELYNSDNISNNTNNDNDIKILSTIEQKFYNKEYSSENKTNRIERLETTLYGSKTYGSEAVRIKQINSLTPKDKKELNQLLLLELLETKLFNTTYPNEKFEARVIKIEEIVCGNAQNGDINQRFEQLTQNIPLNASGFSISENSKISTRIVPKINNQQIKLNSLKDNYFEDINKNNQGKVVRWRNFPITIYFEENSNYLNTLSVKKIISIWRDFIPVELITSKKDADIIIDWKKNCNFTTEMNKSFYEDQINNQVFIHAGKNLNNEYFEQFCMHQLGHALGIWGHSKDPTDIMYDFSEINFDIKKYSNNKSNYNAENISIKNMPKSPSFRDKNTLDKIYNTSAEDLN